MTGPRFSMVLPAQWQVLDFDPATRTWSVDRLVRRALGTAERLEPLRRDAARTYRRMLDDAADRGAFFGATVAMQLEKQPVAASVMAFLLAAPAGPDGAPTTDTEALLLPLTEPADGEELLEVGLVDLPVGASVRLRALVASGVAEPGRHRAVGGCGAVLHPSPRLGTPGGERVLHAHPPRRRRAG